MFIVVGSIKWYKLDFKEGADQCIAKEMLQLKDFEKLRRDRHTMVALTILLKNKRWHLNARKCIQEKLEEWALEVGTKKNEETDKEEEDEEAEEEEEEEDEEEAEEGEDEEEYE